MNTTTLQIPINKTLRQQATVAAERLGFSSLQETVRVFLKKLASGEIGIRFEETVQLSPKAINRYNKIIDEIESGKAKTKTFSDVASLMKHLNE